MARNWNVADAYEALRSGDKEARMDIGRRFPLFATATEDEIIAAIPDYISVRKVEAALKADVGVSEDDVEEVEAEEVEEVKQEQGTAITSPLVGTYYQASGTNQEPFVKVGQHIQEGDTVCIIEAMKVMNEIKATVSGTVLSINVSDGETVEYDQVLMMIG